MKFLLMAIALAAFAAVSSHSEYCLNTNQECTGIYSLPKVYTLKCLHLKCQGDLAYQCKNNLCTVNKSMCKRFHKINETIQSVKIDSVKREMYEKLTENITECPPVKYDLKPKDVCLNTKSCLYMETQMNIDTNGTKKLLCPCVGKNSYYCGLHHCAVHSRACDTFKVTRSYKKTITKCESFNVFAQRKLFG